MKEHDIVVLTVDLPEYGLKAGQSGTIVYCYGKAFGGVFEVEIDGACYCINKLYLDIAS